MAGDMSREQLAKIAKKVKAMPDEWFKYYKILLSTMNLTEEDKAKVINILDPEAVRRGIAPIHPDPETTEVAKLAMDVLSKRGK